MKIPDTDSIYRSVAVMSILTIIVAGPALAQRPPAHKSSYMWFGGHHPSQSNQALPAISKNSAQITNPETSDNDQVRYKVIPIGVLPGKTASFLTVVRAVNNRQHVTGYSFAGDFSTPKSATTGQGFIWRDRKLEALPLLEGWPGPFAFSISERDQIVGTANDVDANGNLIQTAVLWEHEKPNKSGSSSPWLDLGGPGRQHLWRSCGCFRYFYERTPHTCCVVSRGDPCASPSSRRGWRFCE